MFERLLELRRTKRAIKFLKSHLKIYESYKGFEDGLYSEEYRREILNDLYKLKDKYNSRKYVWMRKV